MKSSDRAILMGLAIVGALAAFWFLALAPKRDESSKLGDEVAQLQSSLDAANQEVAAAEAARKDFDSNYRRLVVLGKAVPAGDDTPSLITQLQRISDRSDVDFRTISLSDSVSATTTAPPTTAPTTSTDSTSSTDSSSTDSTDSSTASTDSSSTATSATAPAAATESSAAALPLGATVGPAGLGVMPYSLEFSGGFFQIADFLGRLDGMVHTQGSVLGIEGRLLTVDGFDLTIESGEKSPRLKASLEATSYVSPADQGTLAGATPAGPAPATATPAAETSTSSTTAVPTATATPSP